MEIETKVQALEDEFRLMKGELKQALTDVRDFLVTFPAPTINEGVFERFHDMQTGIGGGGGGSKEMPAMIMPEFPQKPQEMLSADLEVPGQSDPGSGETPEEIEEAKQPENLESNEDEEPEEEETLETETASEDILNEESVIADTAGGIQYSSPKVNILTNLIRWVSVAKRELGAEQLPTFLDVYSQQGVLVPELRQLIMQLADVIDDPNDENTPSAGFFALLIREQLSALLEVRASSGQISPDLKDSIMNLVSLMAEPSPKGKPADVWSRLIMELHGIIKYGDAPIPQLKLRPSAAEGKTPVMVSRTKALPALVTKNIKAQKKPNPMRLKLIMPVGKGVEKEFVFHLDLNKMADKEQALVSD
jgi:hypothetical protein